MNLSSKKVLVINWHWDEELAYPRYPEPGASLEAALQTSPKLDVVPEEEVSLVDGKPVYNRQKVRSHVFASEIALNGQSDYIHQRTFRKQYVNAFIDMFGPDQAEFLFLFHNGDKIGTAEDFIKIQQTESGLWPNARFGMFGGGFGTIYEEKGLLNHSIWTFGLSGEKAAWFDEESMIKALAIKQKNFDYVWAHYWYQTKQKIQELRKRIKMILLTEVAESTRSATRLATQNFLFSLGQKQYHPEIHPDEKVDFSVCKDLHSWVPQEFRGDRLSILQDFIEGKTRNTLAISQYFDDLVRSWKKQ